MRVSISAMGSVICMRLYLLLRLPEPSRQSGRFSV